MRVLLIPQQIKDAVGLKVINLIFNKLTRKKRSYILVYILINWEYYIHLVTRTKFWAKDRK